MSTRVYVRHVKREVANRVAECFGGGFYIRDIIYVKCVLKIAINIYKNYINKFERTQKVGSIPLRHYDMEKIFTHKIVPIQTTPKHTQHKF